MSFENLKIVVEILNLMQIILKLKKNILTYKIPIVFILSVNFKKNFFPSAGIK